MSDLSGVVLAGGHSRRFGDEDKALAALDGEPMVARVVDRLSTVVDEVVVTCRPEQVTALERLFSATPDVEIVEDRHPGAGPLAGIDAGLDAVAGEYVAVVACDMPFVDPALVRELFGRVERGGADAAVPVDPDGSFQPVQAVYRRDAMGPVAARLLDDEASLHAALDELSVVTVDSEVVPPRSLRNVNTLEDLADAERSMEATE